MKHGFVLPDLDILTAPVLAAAAEAAGWDGVFIPDAIAIEVEGSPPFPASDPWVTLAAMAIATKRVTLGPMVAAVTRRRPWKLAREVATLDILSGGRMVLAAGIGAAPDDAGFRATGEAMGLRERLAIMEETLTILDGLWTGEPFSFEGEHHRLGAMTQLPRPVQRPRIPIWVVGVWPARKSMERALRWDGVVLQPTGGPATTEMVRNVAALAAQRPGGGPFSIAVDPSGSEASPSEWAEAGATWLLTSMWGQTAKAVRDRIRAGPGA